MLTTSDRIQDLSIKDLKELSQDIRRQILETMAHVGGHLASNLGTVELLIAMHKVFSPPQDQFIFDTSHQIYAHKILTPRQAPFSSIRQYKGLSGFANPDESPFDHFFAGHAGTGLSLALGVAKARDLSGESFHVLPFICDAPMGCGLTFEALNNLPSDCKRLIIILNDNAMSISDCVGNVHHRILGRFSYPQKSHSSAKKFFEQWGLQYVGPVDGHDLETLIPLLEAHKDTLRPIVIHALTVKGWGYKQAVEKPIAYHGVKPFDIDSGTFHPASNAPTFPKIFGQYLLELTSFDTSIVTVTPAMPQGSGLMPLMKQYPERCIDVGIAEGHAVTFAGGLSAQGKTVFACIYSTFFQRAFDNAFQDVCLQKLPVIFALDRSGLSPRDGVTHHGIYDVGFLQTLPHLIITQPRDGNLLKDLMFSAMAWKQPSVIRYPNLPTTSDTDRTPIQRSIGKGEVIAQGNGLCIIALGTMVDIARKVRAMLLPKGIVATIIDPIFIKPLDEELLRNMLPSHDTFITLEEHALSGGFGRIVNTFLLQESSIPLRVRNLGIGDHFVEQGSYDELMQELGLTPAKIVEEIQQLYL